MDWTLFDRVRQHMDKENLPLTEQIRRQMKLTKDLDFWDAPGRSDVVIRKFNEKEIRRIVREEIMEFFNRLQESKHKREHHAAKKAAATITR